MTQDTNVRNYERILDNADIVESRLLVCLFPVKISEQCLDTESNERTCQRRNMYRNVSPMFLHFGVCSLLFVVFRIQDVPTVSDW